jgi:hypothetical protein
MPWFAVDDSAHTHPKIVKAGNAAMGLWMRCGSYAAQHLTDGIVPGPIATMYGTPPQIAKLTRLGLWHAAGHTCARCPQPADGDYVMHEYHQHGNPTRQEVLDRRAKAAEKKRKQRAGGHTPPQDPGPNRSRIGDESRRNRERIEDESDPIHRPLFDDGPGEDPASPGDSFGTRARVFPSPPLPSEKKVAEVEREGTGRGAREREALSLIAPHWTPSDADRAEAAADIQRLGPAAVRAATAKFIRHQQTRAARAANFGPAWVTWLARERPDTQGAFLVGLPGGATPTPSSFAERMAEVDAAAARDDRPASYGERLADRDHDTA